jgi:hypothetical protein
LITDLMALIALENHFVPLAAVGMACALPI